MRCSPLTEGRGGKTNRVKVICLPHASLTKCFRILCHALPKKGFSFFRYAAPRTKRETSKSSVMVSTTLYLRLLVSTSIFLNYFCSFKLVKNMPKGIRMVFLIIVKIGCLIVLSKLLLALYLFMDELQRAVAQFLPASGGMAGSGGGSSGGGGGGWTSFDLGVLADDTNEDGEEVAQPNLQNTAPNPVEAIPQEPNLDSVKDVLRNRLVIHRLGRKNPAVSEDEIDRIVDLKDRIITRMAQLDANPFWNNHRNVLIRDYMQPPRGGEYKIPVLEAKLKELFGNNPASSLMYKELIRARDLFHIDGPFRGPRGN